jgi:catechol 2,3-dioxygenase-like lactoylglutathione lyase family enzyme
VKVLGISWAGIAVDSIETMVPLFRDILGLTAVIQEPAFTKFVSRDGDAVEVFGRGGPQPPEQFATNRVVVGFLVDDIVGARNELAVAGLELIGDLHEGSAGYRRQHFRGPDGNVYELCFDPGRLK